MNFSRVAAGVLLFAFALALALVLLPGFPRTTLVEPTVLSSGAVPYGVGLGFPKVVAGILILGLVTETRVRSWPELLEVLRRTAPIFLGTLIAVIACAWSLGYVKWDPKWTTLFLVWAPVNLFFTCLAEEAFFRGFVQHELARIGNRPRIAAVAAVAVAAVLFGLVHFAGGWKYVAAGIVAGVGYGWAYHRRASPRGGRAVAAVLLASCISPSGDTCRANHRPSGLWLGVPSDATHRERDGGPLRCERGALPAVYLSWPRQCLTTCALPA